MDCLITLINRIPLCCWSSDFDTLWRRKRNARFLQDFFSCFFLLFKDFPVFQFFSLFFTVSPVFFVFFFVFFFSSKNFEFSGISLHRTLIDPGKPGKPWKINQFYQSQGKVRDFFILKAVCMYFLSFLRMINFFFLFSCLFSVCIPYWRRLF